MGYSCTNAALRSLQAVKLLHGANEPESNMLNFGNATRSRRSFFEVGAEQADGAIVGTLTAQDSMSPHGKFRIEPNGAVTKFPGLDVAQQVACAMRAAHANFARDVARIGAVI